MSTTFEPVLSQRIAALREEIMERKGSFFVDPNPFQSDIAIWRAQAEGRSAVQVRAHYLHEVVKIAQIEILPTWRLVGEHIGGPSPTFGWGPGPDAETLERIKEYGVTDEQVDEIRDAVRAHLSTHQMPYYASGEVSPENIVSADPESAKQARGIYWGGGWVENHSIRDFAKVLRIGFSGIRKEVEACMAKADIADPDFPRKENFWKAALAICDAGSLLGKRYADRATKLAAKATDPDEKARLKLIATTCRRVMNKGARTLFEATQSLWLAHVLTCGEDHINANSIGRMDQILYPYYKADIEADRLTRDEALEIMEELACKMYLTYDVQAITLGGKDSEGNNAVNDMSHIILDASRNVGFVRDLSIRLHKNSPPDFVEHAAEIIARGGGIPFIFNDDCFIKALSDRGIPIEDARDYSPIGCIELTIPGKTNPHAVSGWFNSTKCMELAMFNGLDPRTGVQLGPETGTLADFDTFDEFFEAYVAQVDYFARRMVYHCNRGELRQRERGPLPCWSTLTDDCIARGRDITDNGALYNYHSICLLGTPNTADAMMALKKLVFEEKRVDPAELLDALRADFEGNEPLREMLLKQAPKYGNDQPEVDELAGRVNDQFINLMDTMRSPLGGRYYVHLFSFVTHIEFGAHVGALPDGRHAGQPLAYSLSPHPGRDEKGVTAMLKSLSAIPHDRAAAASAAIIEMDPVMLEGEGGVARLAQIIQTAINMGVGQMQYNIVSVERLKQAQADPENYGNISVRVAGYSQMFKLIGKELQDHIIARTKHKQ